MDHREATDGNFPELYLRQELSSHQEEAFEEHLLYCSECREKLSMLMSAVDALELAQAEKLQGYQVGRELRKSLSMRHRVRMLRLAALLLLLVSLSVIPLILMKRDQAPSTGQAAIIADPDSISDTGSHSILPEGNEVTGTKKENYLVTYAENFVPNQFYENIIENNLRNDGLKIISPATDTLSDLPVFRWQGHVVDSITLVVINNREVKIYSGPVSNDSRADISIKPGLYYWQLQDDKETLITGRFIYLPAAVR